MYDKYQSPLSERYASKEMQYIFSPDKKFKTWRKLWIALAETEYELGLDSVTKEQIEELKAHADDINFDVAKAREKEVRHDVMSHVYAYGVQCPNAKGIIHLGATSCYVGDNTDIIIMTEGLKLIRNKLITESAIFQSLRMSTRLFLHLHSHIFSLHSRLQSVRELLFGCRNYLWTLKMLSISFQKLNFSVQRVQQVHRQALWNCLKEIQTKLKL